ncbi:MAG: hypothetical protein B0D92_07925 [Spirochaeta sp. LUC14_002_19_P3]|nr:MAG: hypothetical protein B0D92_07925 [Spirochaeta sp. LUC14_002_19_P3]
MGMILGINHGCTQMGGIGGQSLRVGGIGSGFPGKNRLLNPFAANPPLSIKTGLNRKKEKPSPEPETSSLKPVKPISFKV